MTLLHRARRLAQAFGVDVRRFPEEDSAYRRVKLIRHQRVDLVLDVGGSDGRYGAELRRFGYRGRIVSFEPLPAAFDVLRARAAADGRWQALPYALGRDSREVTLHVAANQGASSSILPMLDRHLAAAPDAAYVSSEVVQQAALDELWPELAAADRPFLKVDVQGYEREVLAGASSALRRCVGLELELSLVPLYEDVMLYQEALHLADELGFALMRLEPGFTDPATGQMLQAEGVFFRQGRHAARSSARRNADS
jgi:FkbM family methyltransferase